MSRVVIFIINIYRNLISPLFPASCRFIPTCSAYSVEALEKHGFFRGSFMSMKRICRCHPFHPGGYDPVK